MMADKKSQQQQDLEQSTQISPLYLLTQLIKLESAITPLVAAVQKLEETNEGTLRTKGMKEKIAMAQQDIEANKKSFEKLEHDIKRLELLVQETMRATTQDILRKFDEKVAELLRAQTATAAETSRSTTFITKFQPWLNTIAWVITAAAAIILSQVLTGQWYIGPHP